MRRVGAGLLTAVLALVGCKTTSDPKPTDKSPTGATAKTKTKDADPAWLAGGKLGTTEVPKAGTWAKPGDPNFNPVKEAQGVVGGRVIDPYGKGVKRAFIRIEHAADAAAAQQLPPRGILTNEDGYFMTQGLTPGMAYTLTATVEQEGKTIAAVVQAKAPAPNLTIQLRDDIILPQALPPGAVKVDPAGGLPPTLPPPSGDLIPPVGGVNPNPIVTPGVRPRTPSPDGNWVPGIGPVTSQVPATLPNPNPGGPDAGVPKVNPVPLPSVDPPITRVRPENTANGPYDPFKPPAANIPGPPMGPVNPVVPPLPPPNTANPERKSARPMRPEANFALVDTLQRPWDFASSRHGSVVLLDFMTTSCVPCKKSIPVLTDLQARYGAGGLQLVGVVCDDVPLAERASRAEVYHRSNNLNYALFVEPGSKPGAVRDRFNVDGYPTAVLLDGSGAVVWSGHPSNDRAALEAAIKSRLGK